MQQLQTVDARIRQNATENLPVRQALTYPNQPVTPRKHSQILSTSHLGWHARVRERVPDPRARDVVITLAGFMDEGGAITRHVATLARACGLSRSTYQRRVRELSRLGVLRIIPRRVARDYNAPNTLILNIHAMFRGGPGQVCDGRALKAKASTENIRPPAAAPVSPPPKPQTRHIIASSRIASQFCADRAIGHWQRRWLTQRIEDRLEAGEGEEAILADLDRQHRARSSAEASHRSTWRSRRSEEQERMARDIYTLSRQQTPEEFAEWEARERDAQAHEAAGEVWSIMRNGWVAKSMGGAA